MPYEYAVAKDTYNGSQGAIHPFALNINVFKNYFCSQLDF